MTQQEKEAFAVIDEVLRRDELPITFKLLSRKCQISVDTAKEFLASFKRDHQEEKFPASFYHERVGEDGKIRVGISLVNPLEEDKNMGKSTVRAIHIYALYPKKTTPNLESVYVIDSSVSRSDTMKDIEVCRPLQLASVKYRSKEDHHKQDNTFPSSKPFSKSHSDPSFSSKPSSSMQRSSSSSTTPASSSKKAAVAAPKTSFFTSKAGGSTASTPTVGGSKGKTAMAPATSKAASSSTVFKSTMERAKEAARERQADEPDHEVKIVRNDIQESKPMSKASAKQHEEILSMFENEPVREEGFSIDDEVVKEVAADVEMTANDDSSAPVGKVQKRRKVIRTESYLEGKYLKTRDIEEWEIYYEDETARPAPVHKKPASSFFQPAAKKGKGEGGKGGKSRDIASFFGKK